MAVVPVKYAHMRHGGMHEYGCLEMDPLLWSWVDGPDGRRWRVYFINKKRSGMYHVYTLGVWDIDGTFQDEEMVIITAGDMLINDKS